MTLFYLSKHPLTLFVINEDTKAIPVSNICPNSSICLFTNLIPLSLIKKLVKFNNISIKYLNYQTQFDAYMHNLTLGVA